MQSEIQQTSDAKRRVVFYLVYDARGDVDDYIPYKLRRLREVADHIVVVSNGPLSEQGHAALDGLADDIFERENSGYDVGGYQAVLDHFGDERLAEYDELILMNYTWFGPIGSFDPVIARMDALDVDFWGMTDHGATTPNPITLTGTMPAHIQSHWIAVRNSMFTSDAWKQYWRDMPPITSYTDSILHHEARFTSHFEQLGFTSVVAFPHGDYPGTDHPAAERPHRLLDDGCPVLKRRVFFHDPLYLDREGIIGRWLVDKSEAFGYPPELILQSMARNAQPKVLNTNVSMLEILPTTAETYDASAPLRIAAVAHIFYEDMTDEILDRLAYIPGTFELFVTTTDASKAEYITQRITSRAEKAITAFEVRIVESNRGRDISAFYIGCRDVLVPGRFDLVVKLHSKKTVQDGPTIGAFFKRQQFENLLDSSGYAANVVGLFQKEPGLGLVFPPMIHIGYPTLGGAWFTNKEPAKELYEQLGIHVPLDDLSPLAPFGSMFIARPEALALLTGMPLTYDDFPGEGEYVDGTLAHVIERSPSYAAGELGYHTRTIANPAYAAISHTFLEYKLDQVSRSIQGALVDEIEPLRKRETYGKLLEKGSWLTYQRVYIALRHPRLAASLRRILRRGTGKVS